MKASSPALIKFNLRAFISRFFSIPHRMKTTSFNILFFLFIFPDNHFRRSYKQLRWQAGLHTKGHIQGKILKKNTKALKLWRKSFKTTYTKIERKRESLRCHCAFDLTTLTRLVYKSSPGLLGRNLIISDFSLSIPFNGFSFFYVLNVPNDISSNPTQSEIKTNIRNNNFENRKE